MADGVIPEHVVAYAAGLITGLTYAVKKKPLCEVASGVADCVEALGMGKHNAVELLVAVERWIAAHAPSAADDVRALTAPVHILRHGRALCGLPGMPVDWPGGHQWVAKRDREKATCPACRARLLVTDPS